MFFKQAKTTQPSDEALIGSYQESGDIAVLGKLYQRYTGLVFGVCMKYLKDEEDSKDAVMQIFEKLVVSVKGTDIKNFKSWLHVVTKNHCLMQIRAAKKMQTKDFQEINAESNMELSDHLHLNNESDLEDSLQALEAAIKELPDEQKKCIELFYFEQKCYKEIVTITGHELKKVKSYIQNGKRNLKIYMLKNE